jgi:uroporphyrinogen-III decarboxylase
MALPTTGYGAEMADEVWARIEASMNFAEGDRVPIWDYVDNAATMAYFRRDDDDYDAAMVRVYHGLGIDLCRGYGASFTEEHEGKVTEQGKVKWVVSGRTQWVSHYPIQSLEDLRAYQVNSLSDESVQHWVEATRRRQQQFAPSTMYVPGHGCGFHATYGLMGQEFFCYALYDARDEIERIMDALKANAVRLCEAAAKEQLAPLFFIGDDIAYKAGLMFSPQFLRETFLPCLRACCEPLNNAGLKVIYHSDGNLMEIVDDLLDAGIAGLNPIETMAGMDLGVLKKRYGKNLILVGGIDCSQLLPLGTVEEIEAAVKEAMRAAAVGGGLFIGSSSEIVPATPLENVLAFYRACRTYGQYPIRL